MGMQEDLDRLVEWAHKWQMQFNVSKCKVMHVTNSNKNGRSEGTTSRAECACGEEKSKVFILHEYSNGLKSVEVEKDLGIMITSDLK